MREKRLRPDTRATWTALKRAAQSARILSKKSGTPFFIMKNGKIVDLNAKRSGKRAVR